MYLSYEVLLAWSELATLVGISVIGFISALSKLDHGLSIPSCSPICHAAWVRRQADVSWPLDVEIVGDLVDVVSGGFRVLLLEEFGVSFPFQSTPDFHISIDLEDKVCFYWERVVTPRFFWYVIYLFYWLIKGSYNYFYLIIKI